MLGPRAKAPAPRHAFGRAFRSDVAVCFDARGHAFSVSSARVERAHHAFRSMYPLVGSDAATGWVHAARHGEFNGHPSGPFAFTDAVFSDIVTNFEALKNKAVPLTFDHPYYDGTPRELAGWVHKLVAKADGLWALCEFTEKAVEMIRGGSYRFASVVVVPKSTHRETGADIGAELLELAITSSPFIDGLQPIALSDAA